MKKLSRQLFPSEVAHHRKEICKRYDDCLTYAANEDYKSFSCKDCKEFEAREKALTTSIIQDSELFGLPDMDNCDPGGWVGFGKKLVASMRRLGIPVRDQR